MLNWKIHQSLQDAIYHMIYLTVAHCVRHGTASSSDLSTVYTIVSGVMLAGHLQHFEEEDLYGIKSLNLKSHAPGHLRLSSFMDQLQLLRAFTPLLGSSGGPSQLMSNHVLYYESVSISDRYVSPSLSCIVSRRTARLNERVHALMRKHHPHLLMVFFQSSPGHEMEVKHSVTESRSSRHSSLRRSSHHLISKVLIRWHHRQQCRSVHHQASMLSRHQASWSSQR